MAINFPDSPTVDEIYSVGDKSWLWNGTYWEVQGSPTSTFSASDTAPSSPSAGDIWYRSDTSQTLIYYDSTWVEIGHSANIANFLADADADTKIQLEESSDEDTIRFDIAGSEKMALNASSLTVYDSLSVGSGASASSFDASGTGANLMPSGTTAERPVSPTVGMFRFNETTGEPEYYHSAAGWIKFRSTPEVTATYLVIAGGGGGGGAVRGGGGGAGGYRSSVQGESSGGGSSAETPLTLSFGTAYTVTVGAGGNSGAYGASNEAVAGTNGSNTVFHTVTSTGGGGGAASDSAGANRSAGAGGSGGGGWYGANSGAGAGTANQGYAGGSGGNSPPYGGGGGGAGQAGRAFNDGSDPCGGGDGVQSYITGSGVYRAGGGSSSNYGQASNYPGGLGGGGIGTNLTGVTPPVAAANGTDNTGGGGGSSGNGGSGVVIISYQGNPPSSVSAGLTYTSSSVGLNTVLVFTAGTGTVTF